MTAELPKHVQKLQWAYENLNKNKYYLELELQAEKSWMKWAPGWWRIASGLWSDSGWINIKCSGAEVRDIYGLVGVGGFLGLNYELKLGVW